MLVSLASRKLQPRPRTYNSCHPWRTASWHSPRWDSRAGRIRPRCDCYCECSTCRRTCTAGRSWPIHRSLWRRTTRSSSLCTVGTWGGSTGRCFDCIPRCRCTAGTVARCCTNYAWRCPDRRHSRELCSHLRKIPLDGAARAINAITYPGRGNSSWRIHRNSCDWAGSMDLWRSVRCPSNCTGCIHLQIERVERSVSIESCLIRLDQVFRNRCVGIMTSYWIRAKSAYLPQCMHMCLIISFYVCIYLHASLQWRALYSDGNCLDFPQSILTNMPMDKWISKLVCFW